VHLTQYCEKLLRPKVHRRICSEGGGKRPEREQGDVEGLLNLSVSQEEKGTWLGNHVTRGRRVV